jgi:hypothetical protein
MDPNIDYVLTESSFERLEQLLEAEGIVLRPVSRELFETVDASETLRTTNGLMTFSGGEFPYTLEASTRPSKGTRHRLFVRAFEAGVENGNELVHILDRVFPQPRPTRVMESRTVRRLEWGNIAGWLGCLGILGLIGFVIFLAVVGAKSLIGW